MLHAVNPQNITAFLHNRTKYDLDEHASYITRILQAHIIGAPFFAHYIFTYIGNYLHPPQPQVFYPHLFQIMIWNVLHIFFYYLTLLLLFAC